MKQIIEIKSSSRSIVRVGFMLTTACTYSCSYCPDRLHTGKNKNHDLSALRKFLEHIKKNKEIIIDITGGEPTIHPQFLDIIKMCREIGIISSVGSNASRTVQWFKNYSKLVDNWVITLHPSQHILDIDKIKILSDNSFLVVCLIADPAYWNIFVDWREKLSKVENIKLVVLKIIDDWAGANYKPDYREHHLEYIKKYNSSHTFTETKIHQIENLLTFLDQYNNIAVWNDGTQSVVDPYWLIKNDQNNFKNWKCFAGYEVLSIDENGHVYWANCRAKSFGHYSSFLDVSENNSLICPFERCECNTDIRTKKLKLDSDYME
jgi:MoaA/NifB/PqqE/SkfB family radical SAM enzyme